MYYTARAPPERGYPPLLHRGGTGGTQTRVFPCRSTTAVGTQPTMARRGSRARSSGSGRQRRNPAHRNPAEVRAALRDPEGAKDTVQTSVQRSRRLPFLFTHHVLGLTSTKEKLSCTAFPHATSCLCVPRGKAKRSPRPPAPRATPSLTPGLSPPAPTQAQLGSGQPACPLPYGRPRMSGGKLASLCRTGRRKSTHLNAAPKRERREGKSTLEAAHCWFCCAAPACRMLSGSQRRCRCEGFLPEGKSSQLAHVQ